MENSTSGRGRMGKRRSGVALFKSVSLFFTKGSRLMRGDVVLGTPGTSAMAPSGAASVTIPVVPPPRPAHMQQQQGNSQQPNAKKTTHFTREETEALTLIYEKLIGANQSATTSQVSTDPLHNYKAKEGLERSVFRDLLHNTFNICAEDILMERIFCVFDFSSDGLVKLDEWLQGMSIFLRGTLKERTLFAFSVYDLNADGYIVREEIFTLLRNSLVKQPQDEDPEEGVKELVELVLKKLDRDKDGKLSLKDFTEAVEEEPLFLEAFGQCLPSDFAAMAFLATLS